MQSSDTIEMVFSAENTNELDSVKITIDTIIEAKQKFLFTKQKTAEEFEELIAELFPLFKNKYPTLYKMVLKQTDMSMAYLMVEQMKKINNGTAKMDDVRSDFGEKLARQYVYPVAGKPPKK